MSQQGEQHEASEPAGGGQLEPVGANFPKLFAQALDRWAAAVLVPGRRGAKREEFAAALTKAQVAVSKMTIGNWIGGKYPPRGDDKRDAMLIELAKAPDNRPHLADLARACMEAQGIADVERRMAEFDVERLVRAGSARRTTSAPSLPRSGPLGKEATEPAGWSVIDTWRRVEGLAAIDARAPRAETPDGRSEFRVSVSLDTYKTRVPDEDGQSGFPVSLTITGEVLVSFRGKHAELVDGTYLGSNARPASEGLRYAGGPWKIDLASWHANPSELIVAESLAVMLRSRPGATVEAELRCEVRAVRVDGLPEDLSSTTTAILRRLQQFANANVDGDHILMAYSRMDHQPE